MTLLQQLDLVQVLYVDSDECGGDKMFILTHSIKMWCSGGGNYTEQLSPQLGADEASEGLQREPVGAVQSDGTRGVTLEAALMQQDGCEKKHLHLGDLASDAASLP